MKRNLTFILLLSSILLPLTCLLLTEQALGANASFERNSKTPVQPIKNAQKNKNSPSGNSSITSLKNKTTAFENVNADIINVQQGDTAWGDYDNDGDLDILINGVSQPGTAVSRVYRNDGCGNFININANLLGVASSSSGSGWLDYDNDGDLDILLIGEDLYGHFITKIYRNENGQFSDANIALPGLLCAYASWGDYDNDGDLDILVSGQDLNTDQYVSHICRNNGDDTFTVINAGLVGVVSGRTDWGDYDNDGDLDIVLIGRCWEENIAKIYRNDGNDAFTDINANLTGCYGGAVAWGDYDNDGDLDILLNGTIITNNNWPYGITRIYRNDGNNIFTDINTNLPGVIAFSFVAWGDYDNDGYLDVALIGKENDSFLFKSLIYKNNGNNTFTNINANLVGIYMGSIAWGDYDNDGRLDIILTGQLPSGGSVTQIYHNQSIIANTPPAPPLIPALTSSVSGNSVTLSWQKATDNQTPQNGLSYNIYIGSDEWVSDALSPMAQMNNGWRKIPAIGPIQGTTKTIRNLPPGIYYWSVQAIDTALAGSPWFSRKKTFTIGNTYTISGKITQNSPSPNSADQPAPVQGAYIMEGNNVVAVTNENGYYQFTKIQGWSGLIKPMKQNYVFSPLKRKYINLSADQINQNYILK